MSINTENLKKCIETLEKSYEYINSTPENTVEYEIYRNSLVKSFEITLEQAGKLLKKRLFPFFSSKNALDSLTFKDIFRHAGKHLLLTEEEIARWHSYRDNRNNTAHDYGKAFAEETLTLVQTFIPDVKHLMEIIENG